MYPSGAASKTSDVSGTSAALFDAHGRCIPLGLSAPAHTTSRRYFALTPPAINYSEIHARIMKHLGMADVISAREFEQRAEAILQKLRKDPQVSGIANGAGVPFFLPQADYPDYGAVLEDTYLPAVQSAFTEKLPAYSFVNHHKGGLAAQLGLAPASRHQQLLDAMRQAPVVGYFFPCLTEYSVPAALEQAGLLPQQFLLAGGFDTAAALIGTPDLLLRKDGYPPLLWLAALTSDKENSGFHFEAYGYNLTFNRRPHFGQAAECWASSLVVLG
jgi:hypothetical protein